MNADQAEPQDDQEALKVGLYVVGTPIGNLSDISIRALDTLRQVDAILAEDTRHTRKLLTRYEIATPMISCHKFNEAQRSQQIVHRIMSGAALALVSDAGMPGVSDPGARVVDACRAAGAPIYAVPGPSAITTAISLCGFAEGGFIFLGFLPNKSAARRRILAQWLPQELPIAVYESPYRAIKLITELAELAPNRQVFVGRELTKHYEQSLVGTPAEILAVFEQRSTKGEWVIVIGPER